MKTAIITGGTRGIGKAISEMYLKNGFNVIITYVSSEIGKDIFLSENIEYSDKITFIKEDLSDINGLQSFLNKIKSLNVCIDALVLNVGITKRENFKDITYESWNKVFNANLTVPFFIIQGIYDILKDSSTITFISSVLGIKADGSSMQYGISKGALEPMIKYLAKEFSENNIRVNGVAPGFINTEWQNSKSEEHKARIKNKTLLKRFGEAKEIALTCEMLELNKYITGQVVVVDGGYSIY